MIYLRFIFVEKQQLPPAQPWQYPVPAPKTPLPDFDVVSKSVRSLLYTDLSQVPEGFAPDVIGGKVYWGAMFT